jgi:hypothetical protein
MSEYLHSIHTERADNHNGDTWFYFPAPDIG